MQDKKAILATYTCQIYNEIYKKNKNTYTNTETEFFIGKSELSGQSVI